MPLWRRWRIITGTEWTARRRAKGNSAGAYPTYLDGRCRSSKAPAPAIAPTSKPHTIIHPAVGQMAAYNSAPRTIPKATRTAPVTATPGHQHCPSERCFSHSALPPVIVAQVYWYLGFYRFRLIAIESRTIPALARRSRCRSAASVPVAPARPARGDARRGATAERSQ